LTEFSRDREAGEEQGDKQGLLPHATPVPPGHSSQAPVAADEATDVEER